MRRAFIGLSTPIGYDYINPAPRTSADIASSPNPILDSPFGLLLLFDELVFLTRSLCPANMRDLPYVRFLDEEGLVPELTREEIDEADHSGLVAEVDGHLVLTPFQELLAQVGVLEGMGVDNHSHGLSIGSLQRSGNADGSNLAFDMLICSKVTGVQLEIIANSRFQSLFGSEGIRSHDPLIAETITFEGIPNYLTPSGPYHPVIEEVRANKYLRDFRTWISSHPGHLSRAEINEMKDSVEAALKEAQEKAFLKTLDPKRHFTSIGKAIVGDAAGLIIPGSGTIAAVLESTFGTIKERPQYWQGFIVGARQTTRRNMQ